MKKRSKGITIVEILVVVLLASISLFVILQGITGISTAIIRQTEFLNCLSIAKNYIDLYSYYPRGSILPTNTNTTFNIGSYRYNINIRVEDFGNHTNNLNLRRLRITVSSPRQRNLRVSLTTLI
ncbi:MAG: type II secretion system protein [Candidatus Calescibacterium sp.]|nr:type II secretion system GspH family protein [Candidatus Calescibacterium sp.]MDW8195186.1 type II secretion system protein [Candidatus Calescibacterium sp.]